MEVGGLWVVGPSLSLKKINIGKSSENIPIGPTSTDLCWSSISCVFCLYTLLKVVSYYDLSVLSMPAMGFQEKFGYGMGRWGELYPVLFWIYGIFLTLHCP